MSSTAFVMYALFLSDFSENSMFSTDFKKMVKHQTSCKPVQWELSCFMWTDIQT